MTATVATHRAHVVAQFDAAGAAVLDELVPLAYSASAQDLPRYVRAASALRRFENRLVIVQDDVNALATRDEDGLVRPVLLPAHGSGKRTFDEELGNKYDKLDLEACVTLPDGRFVAFGSGSMPVRERLVVWNGREPPVLRAADTLYAELRAAATQDGSRLNIEGAVVRGEMLEIFHRGNDAIGAARPRANAIIQLDCGELAAWLDDAGVAAPRIGSITTVDLGDVGGVPFGFTDAVVLDDERVVVLACAEDSLCALADGAVLGCRVGLLDDGALRTVDVRDGNGARTTLKLEGIERRPESSSEFDVAVDVDRHQAPAQLGRLVWEWK